MTHDELVGTGCLGGALLTGHLLGRAVRRLRRAAPAARAGPPAGSLDRELFAFGGVPWTARDCCEGVLVLGRTGSGKTSGPMLALVERLLDVGGGMLTCIKPSDKERYLRLAAGEPGVVMDATPASHRLNFCDALLQGVEADDATRSMILAAGLDEFAQVADRERRGGGDDSGFWDAQRGRLAQEGFALIPAAGEKPSVPLLLRVV